MKTCVTEANRLREPVIWTSHANCSGEPDIRTSHSNQSFERRACAPQRHARLKANTVSNDGFEWPWWEGRLVCIRWMQSKIEFLFIYIYIYIHIYGYAPLMRVLKVVYRRHPLSVRVGIARSTVEGPFGKRFAFWGPKHFFRTRFSVDVVVSG